MLHRFSRRGIPSSDLAVTRFREGWGGTYTPHSMHECENKVFAKWARRKCMKRKRGLSLIRGRGKTQNGNRSEAGVTGSTARVASINHDLCYHELHTLSNIIIVLIFSEMT